MVTNSDFNFAAYAERVAEMTGCCPLYTGTRGAQPGVKRPTTHSAFKFLVHDFVHRRRAYSGLCGSCVRMFAISYVE
jgi:hypothetical protein